MNDVIDQIINIEKASAIKIENFRIKSRKEIEDFQNSLELKKKIIEKEILEKNKTKIKEAVAESQKKIDSELLRIEKDTDKLSEDVELCSSIKEEIIKIIINT